MTLQNITVEIGGKYVYITHDDANDQSSVSYGDGAVTEFLLDSADEDTRWALAHNIYRNAYGHRCTAGDVRSLQMVLGLINS
jgi:hypothetical protein